MYRYFFLCLTLSTASCSLIGWTPAQQIAAGVKATAVSDGDAGSLEPGVLLNVPMTEPAMPDDRASRTDTRFASINDATLNQHIIALVNRERGAAGIKPLSMSPELMEAARQHTLAMADKGFFEHRGAGEPTLPERVTEAGLATNEVGENIFATSGTTADEIADDCVEAWSLSDGHRENMLSPAFEKTGVWVSRSSDGEAYITEDFAR